MKSKTFTTTSIDDYIKRYPEPVANLLEQIRSTIQKTAPKAIEKINYGIPTFYFNGNLVHFAAFKNHLGFFPTASPIVAFQKELKPYKTSKGTIQFSYAEPLPLKLIERIVKFRMEQNARKIGKR